MREKYRQGAFMLVLQVTGIIALPAFAALFIGKYIDRNNQATHTYTNILLVASFIISWAVIILKYIRFDKKVKEIEKKIKDLKEK